jgi:hypothetical protein
MEILRIASLTDYRYLELPHQKMACITLVGDPNMVIGPNIPALYTTVYGIRKLLKGKGTDFEVDKLRARWSDAEILHIGPYTEESPTFEILQ